MCIECIMQFTLHIVHLMSVHSSKPNGDEIRAFPILWHSCCVFINMTLVMKCALAQCVYDTAKNEPKSTIMRCCFFG